MVKKKKGMSWSKQLPELVNKWQELSENGSSWSKNGLSWSKNGPSWSKNHPSWSSRVKLIKISLTPPSSHIPWAIPALHFQVSRSGAKLTSPTTSNRQHNIPSLPDSTQYVILTLLHVPWDIIHTYFIRWCSHFGCSHFELKRGGGITALDYLSLSHRAPRDLLRNSRVLGRPSWETLI